MTGLTVNRIEDSEMYQNAFEICSPLIERIVAACQGPSEVKHWISLLNSSSSNQSGPITIKRQLSNLSNTSINGSNTSNHLSPHPSHVSKNSDILFIF